MKPLDVEVPCRVVFCDKSLPHNIITVGPCACIFCHANFYPHDEMDTVVKLHWFKAHVCFIHDMSFERDEIEYGQRLRDSYGVIA